MSSSLSRTMSTSIAVTALLTAGQIVRAQFLPVASYSMPNGDGQAAGGAFNYWDDTYTGTGNRTQDRAFLSGGLGQLTDGIVGANDWRANLGNGPAHEWVGWRNFNPTITFDLGSLVQLSAVQVHANNSNIGLVSLYSSMTVAFSADGVSYSNPQTFTTSPAQLANGSARFIDWNLSSPVPARFVNLTFTRSNEWTFISEVRFVPTPSAATLLATAGLIVFRRRR